MQTDPPKRYTRRTSMRGLLSTRKSDPRSSNFKDRRGWQNIHIPGGIFNKAKGIAIVSSAVEAGMIGSWHFGSDIIIAKDGSDEWRHFLVHPGKTQSYFCSMIWPSTPTLVGEVGGKRYSTMPLPTYAMKSLILRIGTKIRFCD